MKTLADVPFNELKIGMKCISRLGVLGTIVNLRVEGELPYRERFDTIFIDWSNGTKSIIYHIVSDKITLA